MSRNNRSDVRDEEEGKVRDNLRSSSLERQLWFLSKKSRIKVSFQRMTTNAV